MARRSIVMSLLFLLPMVAPAADEGRVHFLEQEVRNLQRQVAALSRRIDDLGRPVGPAARHLPAQPARGLAQSTEWLDAGKWQRVRPGLGELEVIGLLGPPTSMRETADGRVLFYALEIGTSGFLGGSVTLRDRVVHDVQAPFLQ
jgi:hypothetical protein